MGAPRRVPTVVGEHAADRPGRLLAAHRDDPAGQGGGAVPPRVGDGRERGQRRVRGSYASTVATFVSRRRAVRRARRRARRATWPRGAPGPSARKPSTSAACGDRARASRVARPPCGPPTTVDLPGGCGGRRCRGSVHPAAWGACASACRRRGTPPEADAGRPRTRRRRRTDRATRPRRRGRPRLGGREARQVSLAGNRRRPAACCPPLATKPPATTISPRAARCDLGARRSSSGLPVIHGGRRHREPPPRPRSGPAPATAAAPC